MPQPIIAPLAFLLLFAALGVALIAAPAQRMRLASGSLCLSLALAGMAGLVGREALPALLLGGLLTLLARTATRSSLRGGALTGLAVWCIAAGFHALPGFSPLPWLEDFGRHHQSLRWHYDKGLAGLLLLMALPARTTAPGRPFDGLWALPAGALAIVACSLSLGLASLAPRWLPGFPLWLAGNLFLTVIAEEAFFRGLLQARLQAWFAHRHGGSASYATPAAVAVTALLFGLVHLGWGWPFAAMAVLAGLFYGAMAGREMRLGRAIAAHVLTNASLILLTHSPLG